MPPIEEPAEATRLVTKSTSSWETLKKPKTPTKRRCLRLAHLNTPRERTRNSLAPMRPPTSLPSC